MPWWNDILGLLREEVQVLTGSAAERESEVPTLKQAQTLLKRTTRELGEARARAEAARRRLIRAQTDLEALTREPGQHPRYRDRLVDLARVVANESELIASFDAHIARLKEIHERIQAQLAKLNRDLQMAQAAEAGSRATRAVNPGPAPAPGKRAPGFRQQRSAELMEQLRKGPKKAPDET